ncbi:MAG: hypothetical protein ACRDIB_06485, partial [Ardenticatenaceae bacterium]
CETLESLGIPCDRADELLRLFNPHVKFFNGLDWGYSVVTLNRRHCDYTAYKVDKTVNDPAATKALVKRLRVRKDHTRIIDLGP